MKTKLLLSLFLASATAFAQNIPGFYTPGTAAVNYDLVTTTASLDESVVGANISWNIDSFTSVGTSVTQTFASSTAEFPNTTALVRTTSTVNGEESINDIYLALPQTGATLMGVTFGEAVLNYNVNNGFIGAFPLSYGYYNSDTVSGSFTGFNAAGNFTGTVVTEVDAYGTFTANVGGIPAGTAVTRLKITQDLAFSAGFLPLGTATQTIYSYYSSQSSTDPVFRSTTTTLNLPLINVNDTTATYEILGGTMNTNQFNVSKINIAPNPVADALHFSGDVTITGVTITDFSGRTILKSESANDISVSHLSAGVYSVAVQSGSGTKVLKMIKQ